MSWRTGCLPRPPVHPRADPVAFDFGTADAIGGALDRLRTGIDSNLAARQGAQHRFADWRGGHRRTYDERRARHEAVLASGAVGDQIARLRVAWDDAAGAQMRANQVAADLPPGVR